jgi:16S rRNA G966 N2-methylase RsmD
MDLLTLSDEAKNFIKTHANDDITKLLLQAHRFPNLPVPALVAQIQARQKAKVKLPDWYDNENIIFPQALSVEQGSSQHTAQFKASLIQGSSLADLTGGMGVDTAYLSPKFEIVYHIEQNQDLQQVTQHNFAELGIQNVHFIAGDSVYWLTNRSAEISQLSWIYLDPHRRDDIGNKVVRLQDCEPNILAIKDLLFQHTARILLKASPMLDIDLALRELPETVQVWVISVENEVKEILFHLGNTISQAPQITCVALQKNLPPQQISFSKEDENRATPPLSKVLRYLYEPNVALLKGGVFKLITQLFGVKKIAPHSHLYTSDTLNPNFIGRSFEVIAVCKLDKKALKLFMPNNKANITTRNFPLTVKQIREKIKVQEGGDIYWFATTDNHNQKVIIVCQKVTSINQ